VKPVGGMGCCGEMGKMGEDQAQVEVVLDVEFPIEIRSLIPYDALGVVELGSVEELLDMLLNREKTPSLQTVRSLKVG